MNWNSILAWFTANWPVISIVLLVVVGIGIQIARGKGKALAQLALDFLLLEARRGLDDVSKEDIASAVSYLYDIAPGMIWFIPWKAVVSKALVETFAWDSFNKLHTFLDSAGSVTLKRSLTAQRKMRGLGIVVDAS